VTTPKASDTAVFDELCSIVWRVLDVEPGDIEINLDDSLTDDLGLESIDLVTIGAMLIERYGEQVNLAAHLAEMDIDDVIALRVGELADFVTARLADEQLAER